MPNLTRADLVSRVGDLIQDPDNTRWTAGQKQSRLEEAQEQFVLDTRALVDSTTATPITDQQEYALPSDVLDINRLAHRGLELQRISKFDLDFYSSQDWTADKGTPKYYYVDLDPNNKKYGLYPIPQGEDAIASSLVIEYIKIPPVLSSDSSVPLDSHTLMIPYHMALAYYAARQLLLADPTQENIVKAVAYGREYETFVTKCINVFRHLSETQPLRFKGGRYFKNA